MSTARPHAAMTRARRLHRRAARGISIVELMVGVTIGLFILAGATLVTSTQLSDNRRMLLENQVHQDLRSAADIVMRDLRRAGYWAQSWRNVWPAAGGVALDNPYVATTVGATSVVYDRSQDEDSNFQGFDNGIVDDGERVGFRYNVTNKTVDMLVSINSGWQALTDPNVLEVTQFDVAFNTVPLPAPCAEQCPTGPNGRPLVLQVRNVTVTIAARATHDASVARSVRTSMRLRNDVLVEVGP